MLVALRHPLADEALKLPPPSKLKLLVAHFADEFYADYADLLFGVLAAKFVNSIFERVALGILFKI